MHSVRLATRYGSAERMSVFLNGLITYGPGGDEILSEQTVPTEIVRSVAAFAAERGAAMVASARPNIMRRCVEWTELFTNIYEPTPVPKGPWAEIINANEPLNKLIVLAPPGRHTDELRPLLSEMLGESASLTMAIPTMLEVLPKGGSKGEGVKVLLDRLGVSPEEVMALGDAENDLGMLELAGLSIAMGNAPPSVQGRVRSRHREQRGGRRRRGEGAGAVRPRWRGARKEAEEALLSGGNRRPMCRGL